MDKRELKRVVKAERLRRQEDGARTEKDFSELIDTYDKNDANRERKERYWEILSSDNLTERLVCEATIIPRPIDHEWWRQLFGGSPLDVIFDCPHEINEFVSSPSLIEPLKQLDESRKEILYYLVIRQWSPQRLAAFRGQTDRNIRKVYGVIIAKIRKRLYKRLSPRYEEGLPLTFAQTEFCEKYKAGLIC